MQGYGALKGFGEKRPLRFLDFVAFIIPLTQAFKFSMVGDLYGPDILYPAVLMFFVFTGRREMWPSEVRTALILIGIWLVGAMITDAYRGTETADMTRGWLKIALFAVIFCSIFRLVRNDLRRMMIVILGHNLGSMVEALINPSLYAGVDPWKFGVGHGVTALVIFLVGAIFPAKISWRIFGGLLITAMSFISLALNVRALFGTALLTGIFALAKIALDRRQTTRRISPAQLVFTMLLLMVFVQGSLVVYGYSAEAGWLGTAAKSKYEAQASSDLGLLFGGRDEILVSTQAVIDSPILGHGSWAQDAYYVLMLRELLEAKGIDVSYYGVAFEQNLIPSHSHLMGAWVEAGLAGGIFWLWALIISMRASYAMLNLRRTEMILVVFALVSLVWNIFFSPFSGYMRFQTAAPLYLAIMLIGLERQSYRASRYKVQKEHALPSHRAISKGQVSV